MIPSPSKRPPIGGAATAWWSALQEPPHRGDRAALSRCSSTVDVRFQPSWHDLARRVGGAETLSVWEQQQLAVVGAVLAHVRTLASGSVAAAMGVGERPAVSDLRFRRLLATKDPEELRVAMIRAVHLLGRAANVEVLADSIFTWGDPRRLQWAEDYYRGAMRPASKT